MPVRRSTLVRPLVIIAAVTGSSLYAIAQQPPTPSRVRGTIEAVDGDGLSVKSRSGEDFKLHMAVDMRVVGITRISLADIKVGSFIGATTVPGPDGQAERGRGACVSLRACAAPARDRGRSICAPTRP